MIGLDTGFFVKILEGQEMAIQAWKELIEGDEEAVCSALTLFELERLALKGKISQEGNATLQEAISGVCKIFWLNDKEIMYTAARMSHGLGMPAVDSIILAGFIREGSHRIYTTDGHFEVYKKKGVEIINLEKII
ncbi:MAG: type II toxin-antitoxin system VapC family toxin [Desulfobacteria bacterium]|jgi:predicted nucleic acid-binding protein|nr:type II toxin-antitoxin system VapC family toxin [Deltaproteobacteria bacterium]